MTKRIAHFRIFEKSVRCAKIERIQFKEPSRDIKVLFSAVMLEVKPPLVKKNELGFRLSGYIRNNVNQSLLWNIKIIT